MCFNSYDDFNCFLSFRWQATVLNCLGCFQCPGDQLLLHSSGVSGSSLKSSRLGLGLLSGFRRKAQHIDITLKDERNMDMKISPSLSMYSMVGSMSSVERLSPCIWRHI